jgi:hypothetical protein
MRMFLPPMRTVLLVAAVVAIFVGAGVATGAIPGGDGAITACYKAKGGAVRVIDVERGGTCASDEVKLAWSQTGPTGPAGPQGDKGEPGPQGQPACDASRLLLCPDADLPSGESVSLTIDGVEFLQVSRYRINCETNNGSPSCELVLTGTASASVNVDNWYLAAAQGQPTARRDFTVAVRDASGTTLRRFFVVNGRPTALLNQGDSYQLTLSADSIQKLAA